MNQEPTLPEEPVQFLIDPAPPAAPEPPPDYSAKIDYQAKDYASFRRLMLDHLAQQLPDWHERHAADAGITLVELLAYAADYLSYYQDAVASEAFLKTSRQRISMRRRTRLLSYGLNESCNARVWVQLQTAADQMVVPRGACLVPRIPGQDVRLPGKVFEEYNGPVFETMHDAVLFHEHNQIQFSSPDQDFQLPEGATEAALKGHYAHLAAGDVLVLELSEEAVASANSQVVRLRAAPVLGDSPQGPVTRVQWYAADALRSPLPVTRRLATGDLLRNLSVARGNMVLADHGRTIYRPLPPVPKDGIYAPALPDIAITHAAPYHHDRALQAPALMSLQQDPALACAQLELLEYALPPDLRSPASDIQRCLPRHSWLSVRDLLSTRSFDREFIAEIDNYGKARLRFSTRPFQLRPQPGSTLLAKIRVGQGSAGNIGVQVLAHIVSDDPRITGIRNPLPGQGGVDPESQNEARINAPQAMCEQWRCVTGSDYSNMAARYPGVRAAAAFRASAGGRRVAVYIDPGNRKISPSWLPHEVCSFLEPCRMIGDDLEVLPAGYVCPGISVKVAALSSWPSPWVVQAVQDAFCGPDGFFSSGRFEFGQPLYRNQLLACAMAVTGVAAVRVIRFEIAGPKREEIRDVILVKPNEMIRLDNDARSPEFGFLQVSAEGEP